jgi:ribosomal protein L30
MAARLKVTQIKSKISEKQNQRDTLRSLGLKRIGDVVVREDSRTGATSRPWRTWSASRRSTDG